MRLKTHSVVEMPKTGMHLFEITVKSNDPVEPEKKLYIRADFEPME